jgi:D-alanine-D-alanine ligase
LPTPAWREVVNVNETEKALTELGTPMIVKPAREGSTLGLTKVTDAGQCASAYALAAEHDSLVLCEQFISGDEVTVTVLGSGAKAKALPVIRVVAPSGNYDYHNKYFGEETKYHVPCGLPEGEEESIQEIIVKAYRTLGCKGWARADVMIDNKTRKPYLLEINTSPGMTSHSLVPMSASAAGMSYEDLCMHILRTATLEHSKP